MICLFFFFKQKTAYEMRISDWSSDVCSSDLADPGNGCVPMNIFGEGALGAASIAWVTGLSDGYRTRQDLDFRQDVWSIDAQYEPFSTWAIGRASCRERVCQYV